MGSDDDIASALPRPPLPAPARREAAIEAAMRRFDGDSALPPRLSADAVGAASAPWWRRPAFTYAGAFASIALVALVALPLAWTPLDEPRQGGDAPPGSVSEPVRPETQVAAADQIPAARAPVPPSAVPGEATRTARARDAADGAPVELALAVPPRAPLGQAEKMEGVSRSADPTSDFRPPAPVAPPDSNILVTGSRISRPSVATRTASEAGAADSPVAVTGAPLSAAGAAGRGDWNACTIDDPGRSLAACRQSVDPAARGSAGRAAAQVAAGLERAWQGDLRGAIEAFDRAIEIAPRSSSAYLNRGLALQKSGDLDRALADLDRAVTHAPRSARAYYRRSLLLRQRGDTKRAAVDEKRAVALDPSYEVVIP
jgi:hypothetical protein